MASGEVMRLLPPPSYRHRQPPPPEEPPPPPEQHQQQQHQEDGQQSQQQQPQQQHQQNGVENQGQEQEAQNGELGNDSQGKMASPTFTSGGDLGVEFGSRHVNDLSYMHRPPAILPNYGKRSRGSVLPKSNVSRVLLYDNITQQSMLDVRINSIRSQSYKTNRELDMHMKSFMTRRKAREKALKRITRVPHFEDYSDFVQEQELMAQHSGAHIPHSSASDGEKDSFLPKIKFRRGKHKPGPSAKSLSSSMKISLGAHEGKSHSTPSTGRVPLSNGAVYSKQENKISLPHITVSSPSRDHPDHGSDENESRKIGLRFETSSQGVTRIFQVVPEFKENSTNPENRPGKIHKEQRDEALNADENNNEIRMSPSSAPVDEEPASTPINRSYLKPRASIFQIQKKREEELLQQKKQQEELERLKMRERSEIITALHPDKPMIDSRFLHLRRLLVPQNPPNEGFTELSPSFPKRYPSLKDLATPSDDEEPNSS